MLNYLNFFKIYNNENRYIIFKIINIKKNIYIYIIRRKIIQPKGFS